MGCPSPERLSRLFKVTGPDSPKVGEKSCPGLSASFPHRPSCFWEAASSWPPFALPGTSDNSGFRFPGRLISYPSGSLAGGRGLGPAPPPGQHQGTWPAVQESHFITSPFSPAPSSRSSCGVAWCLLGSKDGLSITTTPASGPYNGVGTARSATLATPKAPLGSQFSQMGALGRVASRVFLCFPGSF